ncbi:response regulator transcription factor [Ideonella livida]|uniref:Response regulator n=1 Tax=Ideonella livida TaxID=2707176 RepID=A0A7C9TJB0_9BURK|nr:response regulator [Ideonella livida]NDY90485.1 response regulator [Ideonella livida]
MKRRVLTIDDQADIRRLIRMTLEFEGFEVLEASHGEEGLAMARREKPDLILLDVMMPGINGLAVSQALQADERLSRIPVVMLTALDRDSDMEAGLAAGAKVYLAKPFGPIELIETVGQLIDESRGVAS